jgi:hypothetical protein
MGGFAIYCAALFVVVFTWMSLPSRDRVKRAYPAPLPDPALESWHELFSVAFSPVDVFGDNVRVSEDHIDVSLEPADRLAISAIPTRELDRRLDVLRTGLRFDTFTETGIRLVAVGS